MCARPQFICIRVYLRILKIFLKSCLSIKFYFVLAKNVWVLSRQHFERNECWLYSATKFSTTFINHNETKKFYLLEVSKLFWPLASYGVAACCLVWLGLHFEINSFLQSMRFCSTQAEKTFFFSLFFLSTYTFLCTQCGSLHLYVSEWDVDLGGMNECEQRLRQAHPIPNRLGSFRLFGLLPRNSAAYTMLCLKIAESQHHHFCQGIVVIITMIIILIIIVITITMLLMILIIITIMPVSYQQH